MKQQKVETLLRYANQIQIGSGSAAAFGTISHTHQVFVGQTGWCEGARNVGPSTYFDLASLTKILATTTLAMIQVDSGALDLDADLAFLLPERVKANPKLASIRVRDLLTHSSGLPAWRPFYLEMIKHFGPALSQASILHREQYFCSLLYQVTPEHVPGEKIIYSDLGFLILEEVLSSNFKRDVESVWKNIPNCELQFREVISPTRHLDTMMTEICPWRGLLQGQVHDDNAWSKGGFAGHAGVFGRLQDVVSWIKTMFSSQMVSERTLRLFFTEFQARDGGRRALGFDIPSLDGSGSTGFSFSRESVGHLGFTGSSLWFDLNSGDFGVLLTNRVHPHRTDDRIRPLRRAFHQIIRNR